MENSSKNTPKISHILHLKKTAQLTLCFLSSIKYLTAKSDSLLHIPHMTSVGAAYLLSSVLAHSFCIVEQNKRNKRWRFVPSGNFTDEQISLFLLFGN